MVWPTTGERRIETWISQVRRCAASIAEPDTLAERPLDRNQAPWRPHNLPLPYDQGANIQSYERPELRCSRDSILRSPHPPLHDARRRVSQPRNSQTFSRPSSSEGYPSAEPSIFVSEAVQTGGYERRPRKKTREDRYQKKKNQREHRSQEDRKARPQNKRQVRRDKLRSGKEVMDTFASTSLGKIKVAIKPNLNSSFFSNGKISQSSTMADLEFNDMAFLIQDSPVQALQASRSRTRKYQDHQRPRDIEEEHGFFQDARKQDKQKLMTEKTSIRQSVETAAPVVHEPWKPDILVQNTIGKETTSGRKQTSGSEDTRGRLSPSNLRHAESSTTYTPQAESRRRSAVLMDAIPESIRASLIGPDVLNLLQYEDDLRTYLRPQSSKKALSSKNAAEARRCEQEGSTTPVFHLGNSAGSYPHKCLEGSLDLPPYQAFFSDSQNCSCSIANVNSNTEANLKEDKRTYSRQLDKSGSVSLDHHSPLGTPSGIRQMCKSRLLRQPSVHEGLLHSVNYTSQDAPKANNKCSSSEKHKEAYQYLAVPNSKDSLRAVPSYEPELNHDISLDVLGYGGHNDVNISSRLHTTQKQAPLGYSSQTEDLLSYIKRAEQEILGCPNDLEQGYHFKDLTFQGPQADQLIGAQSTARFGDSMFTPAPQPSMMEEQEMVAFWRPNYNWG